MSFNVCSQQSHWWYLHIFFWVASLLQGQLQDCVSAKETTLMIWSINWLKTATTTNKAWNMCYVFHNAWHVLKSASKKTSAITPFHTHKQMFSTHIFIWFSWGYYGSIIGRVCIHSELLQLHLCQVCVSKCVWVWQVSYLNLSQVITFSVSTGTSCFFLMLLGLIISWNIVRISLYKTTQWVQQQGRFKTNK